MTSADPQTVTRLLQGVRGGDASAGASLAPLIYGELGSLAAQLFAKERPEHTLQPTALIHEAWVKLVGHLGRIEDRQHFFALASQAMRQVLADHARGAARLKRGGGRPGVTLDSQLGVGRGLGPGTAVDLVDLDDSLTRLAHLNARHARVAFSMAPATLASSSTSRPKRCPAPKASSCTGPIRIGRPPRATAPRAGA